VRGGRENGERWGHAGRGRDKHRSIDDFIAAAEFLVRDGRTRPDQLTAFGGSNGGLLVAAALMQRPDLFGAAVCMAPLADMVRYPSVGCGAAWIGEHGDPRRAEDLEWLLSYSPYHRVRHGVAYAAILIAAFEGDTRVHPMHARKLCAALQHAGGGTGPVILREERDVGHGQRSAARVLEFAADALAFAATATGLRAEADSRSERHPDRGLAIPGGRNFSRRPLRINMGIGTGQLHHRRGVRLGAMVGLVSCVVAATLAAAPGAARAVVPKIGAWESGSRSEPRVSFDVRGPARSRTVLRVSFPITCKGTPSAVGWGSTDIVRVGAEGRFTAYDFDSVIRGRFTTKNRAEVTVSGSDVGGCKDTRRYVVLRRGRRIAVRTGGYLSLVGGVAAVGLESDAFGRMVRIDYMDGSIPAGCSDGSQRPLTLAGPDDLVLAAPIRPDGRFEISAAAGSSIKIAGAESENYPSPPAIIRDSG
jgi:dienelactone hydrolase